MALRNSLALLAGTLGVIASVHPAPAQSYPPYGPPPAYGPPPGILHEDLPPPGAIMEDDDDYGPPPGSRWGVPGRPGPARPADPGHRAALPGPGAPAPPGPPGAPPVPAGSRAVLAGASGRALSGRRARPASRAIQH